MFRRKAMADCDDAAAWVVLEGEHDGLPLFASFNRSFRKASDRSEYGIQVGVAVPFKEPNEFGFPGKVEMQRLDVIEDTALLLSSGHAYLVGRITTGGMRELILYTKDTDWIPSFTEALRARISTHEVQVMSQPDPDWSTYGAFVT